MAIVTITSDLGTHDYYLAALKGAIYTHCDTVTITDVTHQVKTFDIRQAAFITRSVYRYFPKGSIHIVHVNAADSNGKLLVAMVDDHYFITFDNGILSLAFDKMPHRTYQVNDELLENSSRLFETAIAKVVELLTKEYMPNDFGHPATESITMRLLQPSNKPGNIRGTVIYIDHFGNAITNITKQMFDEYIGNRKFSIITNAASTDTISRNYTDVEEGEMVCMFNASGLLEVAINKGKAEHLLGLKTDVSAILIICD